MKMNDPILISLGQEVKASEMAAAMIEWYGKEKAIENADAMTNSPIVNVVTQTYDYWEAVLEWIKQ
jgi:hypothetical protein